MEKKKQKAQPNPQQIVPYLLYKDVGGAADPEGHQWYFAQHIRDVSPEEMKKAAKKQ